MKMKIGQLAKMAGCPVVTIRFYEKEGLLGSPERSGGNYRMYGEEDMERLRFVLHCRQHGMKLSEIRELLAFKDNPGADCSWVGSLVATHIADVEAQIASLSRLKAQLEGLLHKCAPVEGEGGQGGRCCGIVASLSATDGCPYCEDLRCRHNAS